MAGTLMDLTVRKEKTSKTETEYGNITYEKWCRNEEKRIGNCVYKENKTECWLERKTRGDV